MNLSTVKSIAVPEGNVTALSIGGIKAWGGGSGGGEPAELYSWEGVAYHINKGTYKDVYAIGDMVPLDLGSEGIINMQIVAFDTDILADGSGNAAITWVAADLLKTKHRMNPSVVRNYSYPEIDSWSGSNTSWTTQNRYVVSVAEATWTITATDSGTLTINYKTSNATATNNTIDLTVNGEVIATGHAKTSNTSHSVAVEKGDVVTVTAVYNQLKTQNYYGTVSFSCTGGFSVAADVKKAPNRVTDSYENGTGTIGGWPECEMRTYLQETIKPMIPEYVQNLICEVSKSSRGLSTSGKITYYTSQDELWLPGSKEVGDSSAEGTSVQYEFLANNIDKDSAWWTRSGASNTSYQTGNYYFVSSSGSLAQTTNAGCGKEYCVCLGFCTGRTPT